MTDTKNVFIIIGSASNDPATLKLIDRFADVCKAAFHLTVYNDLKTLPHFDPALSANNPPHPIVEFRNAIARADGVVICTPEYVFSIPSGLKNAIEWCVSTTLFSGKPVGLITASLDGRTAHNELQLIMKTIMADFTAETTLLISGIKQKLNEKGEITDRKTLDDLTRFATAFETLLKNTSR